MSRNKLMLIIMDGIGLRGSADKNAFKNANIPNLKKYLSEKPHTELKCNGLAVGLPAGVMGNSEVGHLNIGAGRVVMQNLVRIDDSLERNKFAEIPEFKKLIKYVKENKRSLHLMGLLSDAGVHSDFNHLKKILRILKENDLWDVFIHAITDGRDTPPNSGKNYLADLLAYLKSLGVGKLATVTGRYYAMDRDNRWKRVQIAYEGLTAGAGVHSDDPLAAVQTMYDQNITDEFLKPIIVDYPEGNHLLRDQDAVLTFNFRADRMREIAIALNFEKFDGFKREVKPALFYNTMTSYKEEFTFPVLFPDVRLKNIFGEIISAHGLTQLRIAETEKYPHVTYFFNGGEEQRYPGEDRIMVPSPKVATYDLQPEMSAPEVTDKLMAAIENDAFDVIILNFANGDMVGHTGVYEATLKAVETVDAQVGKLVDLFTQKKGTVLITADHGNAEEMWDAVNNQPHTQHSMNPVPFIVVTPDNRPMKLRESGSLCDIAPTMLEILNIAQPEEMDGKSLLAG